MVENMRLIKSNKYREEELEVEILTEVTPGQTHGEVRIYPRARWGRTPGCCGDDPGPGIQHAGGLHAKHWQWEPGEDQPWLKIAHDCKTFVFVLQFLLFQIKSVMMVVMSDKSTQTQHNWDEVTFPTHIQLFPSQSDMGKLEEFCGVHWLCPVTGRHCGYLALVAMILLVYEVSLAQNTHGSNRWIIDQWIVVFIWMR